MKRNLAYLALPVAGVFALSLGAPLAVSANSAPAYWRGADGMGVVATDGNCPVEVEKETLTLQIPALPKWDYASQAEFEEYRASVTAEYTFRNPTEEALTVGLAFPFGCIPEYLADRTGEERRFFDDSALYAVTVGGEPAETQLRYTFYEKYGDLALPADTKEEKGLFKEDADCYEYAYAVDTKGAEGDYILEVRLSYSPARTRILCDYYRYYKVEDGDLVLYLYADETAYPAHFFVVGEQPQVKSVKALKDADLYNKNLVYSDDAEITTQENKATFGEWIESERPTEKVGEIDWYNAVLAYLEMVDDANTGLVGGTPSLFDETSLMRWFTYSLEIPQGGTVVNSVTAPLYPDIFGREYNYRYLLSPAQNWAKFGTFELKIHTPYSISDCSLTLENVNGDYLFSREGLPIGELDFTIEGNGPNRGMELGYATGLAVLSAIAFLFLPELGLQVIAGAVTGIVFGCIAHNKKKKAISASRENAPAAPPKKRRKDKNAPPAPPEDTGE